MSSPSHKGLMISRAAGPCKAIMQVSAPRSVKVTFMLPILECSHARFFVVLAALTIVSHDLGRW